MGVGVQGEAGGEVTKHTGLRLDVHAILQGDGCKGVAEVSVYRMIKEETAELALISSPGWLRLPEILSFSVATVKGLVTKISKRCIR